MKGPQALLSSLDKRTPSVLFGFIWLLAAFFLVFSDAYAATVKSVRLGENAGKTRLVLDIDQNVKFSYFLLADPYRIVLDLPDLTWAVEGNGDGTGTGVIETYRYGQFQPGTSRVVLDLAAPAEVERIFILPPQSGYKYRLVVDLNPVTPAEFLVAMQKSASAVPVYTPPSQSSAPKPMPSKRTIVIDAGHGGVDPGAIGAGGQKEKKIVLATALEIKRELEKTGNYRVLLTRDTDIFIPHRQRFEYARNAGADLFISIHADAIKNKKIRGATVYTLSEKASDRESAALARKENKSDLIAGVDLRGESSDVANILLDLAMRETMNYSARFAEYLVPELKKHVLLRENSHRFAGFLVLKAPDVPSVLLEIGYLSNRQDAKQMASRSGREKIAKAIAGAVEDYFTSIVAYAGQ
ncbi:MAG: N-acetylmuramoyl-L-alanine amidase [Sphingomonadales bacterium]